MRENQKKRPPRSRKRKRAMLSLLLVLLCGSVGISGYYRIREWNVERVEEMEGIVQMPDGYLEPCEESGTLEILNYRAVLDKGHGQAVNRRATVYLPAGYDPSEQYDILYIMHGRGGSYRTWLGTPAKPRRLKNLMDHMIAAGEIPPMIVVAPNLPYEYGSDDAVMEGASYEITTSLMPAAESTYHTYSDGGTDEEAFRRSRDHRIMAGFSMGGSVTWHILKDHIDRFKYYLPMSMALYYDESGYSKKKSLAATAEIVNAVRNSGYGPKDYEIFAASGEADKKAEATLMQIVDLSDHPDVFPFAENYFSKSRNTMVRIWPERWHRYTQSFPYIYNGLLHFCND